MRLLGLQYDGSENLAENTITYLNAKRRTVSCYRRAVHESKELIIPPQYSADYSSLKELIEQGDDLTHYLNLSRDMPRGRAGRNDKALNAWGLHHLHLRPDGTDHVLLVRITDTDIFVIKALPHGEETWVDTSLLQILRENWPGMDTGEIAGVYAPTLTATERANLRRNNINFFVPMPDGSVHMGARGGISVSGRCILDVRDSQLILAQLAHWQRVVEENEANLHSALNVQRDEEFWIRMRFNNGGWRLYEAKKNVEIRLTIQPIDARAESDFVSGHLDSAIRRALDDKKNDRVRPF